MLKPIRLIGVFALLVAIGFLTAGGCFDGDMQKYTAGGTTLSAACHNRCVYEDGEWVEDCADKANFGGVLNACECGDLDIWDILFGGWFDKCVESNFLYHDKLAGIMVKLKATDVEDCSDFNGEYCDSNWYSKKHKLCCACVEIAESCPGECPGPVFDMAAKVKFRIQGPLDNGNQHGWKHNQRGVICATDNGEGASYEPDVIGIKLEGGPDPYDEYVNCGEVSGNVQQHECEYEDADFMLDM